MPDDIPIDRLKRRAEFLAAAKGMSAARGAVVIQALPQPERAGIRVGFTATKRIGGAVIRNRAKDAAIVDGQLVADAGSPMAMLVKRCTAEALTGLEFGISIPGTLGGAL